MQRAVPQAIAHPAPGGERDRQARPLRICVTGPECTGKTTLALALARHYAAPYVREFGRDYFEEKQARGDASVHTGDIIRVTEGQARLEDHAARWTGPLIICDTDVFTVAVWAPIYLHERRPEIDALAQERIDHGSGVDLYLLCAPDIPFVPGDVRTSAERRNSMHGTFRDRLIEADREFAEVSGSERKRLATAIAAIDDLLERAGRTR